MYCNSLSNTIYPFILNLAYYHDMPQEGTWPQPSSSMTSSSPQLTFRCGEYLCVNYVAHTFITEYKNIKRIPYMHILMSDATYTQFASMGPHPCSWHQTRAHHKRGVMENLGVWVSTSVYLRPRFTLCSVTNLPGWLIHSFIAPPMFCLQQHAVKVSHANLYARFRGGYKLWKTHSKHRYQTVRWVKSHSKWWTEWLILTLVSDLYQ